MPNKRYLVIPDLHAEYADLPAFFCMIGAIGVVKPDGFICLGDVGEWESASHWQWKKKKRPPLDYQLSELGVDIKIVNGFLDIIDEHLDKANVKEKHMIQGNHDEWVDRLVEENPHLERTSHDFGKGYLFKDAVGLKKRGYKFHPVGKLLKIGHLRYYHGHHVKSKTYHARRHLQDMGCNVMYGHWHDFQQHSITQVDGEKSAWCIGCLKRMDHDANQWLGRRPTNWGHGFAVVDYFGNDFNVTVHRIINGKTCVGRETIDGNKKARAA